MPSIDQLSDDDWAALVAQVTAMPDAPAPWLVRARGLLPVQPGVLGGAPQAGAAAATRGPAPPGGRSPMRRWLAVVSFDSALAPPVAIGMRALRTDVRQLLFTWQDIDLDLQIAPMARCDGWALSGQLLGTEPAGHLSLIGPGAAHPRVALFDGFGEFRLTGVAAGQYQLSVHLGSDVLDLPTLHIGAANLPGS